MPLTLEEINNKPTIFDELKGKSVPEVIEQVIYRAFKGLTGRDPTIFKWIGKGTPNLPKDNRTPRKQ